MSLGEEELDSVGTEDTLLHRETLFLWGWERGEGEGEGEEEKREKRLAFDSGIEVSKGGKGRDERRFHR